MFLIDIYELKGTNVSKKDKLPLLCLLFHYPYKKLSKEKGVLSQK